MRGHFLYGINRIVTLLVEVETLPEPNFHTEASNDNPVFISFRAAMLRKLSDSPGSPDGASSTTHHDGSLGTDDSSGFYDRSTHPDYNEGGGPGRDAGAAYAKHPGTGADRPGATGKPEHAHGALPNFIGDANSAERICPRSSAEWYDRGCAQPITDSGAGRAAFESYGDAHKQSPDESAGEFGECSCSFRGHFADESSNYSQRGAVPANSCPWWNADPAVNFFPRESTSARARKRARLVLQSDIVET
jgi:hypothetical protein